MVRRPAPITEVSILVLAVLLFGRLHAAAGHDVGAAEANARAVQAVERAVHLNVESAANGWLVGHPAFILPAVYLYRLYYAVLLGVLVWVYLRHPQTYLRSRRALLVMAGLALLVYWAFPLAPPRLALPGIVDVVARHDIFGHALHDAGGNQYSAMPSMHVGWAAWCAYAAWSALRPNRPGRAWLAWLFPVAMAAVVLTIGAHYLLDLFGSAVVLTLSLAASRDPTAPGGLPDHADHRAGKE